MTRDVHLMGGPLDGMVLPDQPVTDDPGAYMVVPGEERRAVYEPRPGEDPTVWHHQGYTG